jgi:N-acyl amino acid synthase of PEP-CTERM/exosortase system
LQSLGVSTMTNPYQRFRALHVEGEGSRRDLAESFRLRYAVFCREENFLPPQNYPDHYEYDSFDELSEHIIVHECTSERLAGTVRLVRYSQEWGFPTAQHFPDLYATLADLPLAEVYEISRLCISPRYRQRLEPKDGLYGVESYMGSSDSTRSNGSSNHRRYPIILILLLKKLYQVAVSLGGNYLIASMEAGLIRYLSMCGMESMRLTNEYIDFCGKVMPCILDINKVLARMSQKRPELHEFFLHDDLGKVGEAPEQARYSLA